MFRPTKTHLAMIVALGVGSATGTALAAYSHSANGWDHGVDGQHVWMNRTTSAASEGVVAAVDDWSVFCSGYHAPYHTAEVRYTANHVHGDFDSGCWRVQEGHFSSPSPYLGHHAHSG